MAMAFDLQTKSAGTRRRRSDYLSFSPQFRGLAARFQRDLGNQAIQSLLACGGLQAKLTTSRTDDPAEREADEIADRIIGPRQTAVPQSTAQHRHANASFVAGSSTPTSFPAILDLALHSRGRPLEPGTRTFFESRLGEDLGDVRIHTDQQASDSARSIHARAYTIGSDIAFATGQYSPDSHEGKRLLAHELVHAIQQSRRSSSGLQRMPDLGGLVVNVSNTVTGAPMSGVKVHIDQKLVSSSKSMDLVTDRTGSTPYIQLEEGDYTITVIYQCCSQTQDVRVTGNQDQFSFFTLNRCACGVSSADQSGDTSVASAGTNQLASDSSA